MMMTWSLREDSPTDTTELWMPERNEEDIKFERASTDTIPTKKHPQSVSQQSIVQQRKKTFKDLVRGGIETQTSYLPFYHIRSNEHSNELL